MKTKKITIIIGILFVIFLGSNGIQAQENTGDVVTASVNCTSLGTLNGNVSYQYDATLKNNTSDKLRVEYTILFKAGDVVKKRHSHSTILIPDEELTETNEGSMTESDWNLVTRCWIEWTATKQ